MKGWSRLVNRAPLSSAPPVGVAPAEWDARIAMAETCREMSRLGLNQGSSGNISLRHGTDMLLTPSAIPYDALRPDMIVRTPIHAQGEPQAAPFKPSSEWRLHRDLLRRRPEINAVAHCHPVHATALSMLRRPLPAVHYMIVLFGGSDVRCAPYAPFGTQELSDRVFEALCGRTAALLAAHGAVALGPDLCEAMHVAQELETLCRMYLLACGAGEPHVLSQAEVDDALARFGAYRSRHPHEARRGDALSRG